MNSEVSLDELLDEPIVRLLMRRDGVEAHEVRAIAETIRRRLASQHGPAGPACGNNQP